MALRPTLLAAAVLALAAPAGVALAAFPATARLTASAYTGLAPSASARASGSTATYARAGAVPRGTAHARGATLTPALERPAPSATHRAAAARRLTRITLAFGRAQAAQSARAATAGAAGRRAARHCGRDWRAAPPQLREELGTLWFSSVSGRLWHVDRPAFTGWAGGLHQARGTIAGAPVLARAARAVRADVRVADALYGAVPDVCATVRAWHLAAWDPRARPRVLTRLARLRHRLRPVPAAAVGALRRSGPAGGAQAARLLAIGVDEPDAKVEAGGCDPIGGLLLDHYAGCAMHTRPPAASRVRRPTTAATTRYTLAG